MRRIPDRWLCGGRLEGWEEAAPAFFQRTAGGWTAYHLGPDGAKAGPMRGGEDAALARSPLAALVEEEVEALLARRGECYLVPVRACYELASRLRRAWVGRGGGDEVREEVDRFFAGVRARCAT
jgi:hypothetical protein